MNKKKLRALTQEEHEQIAKHLQVMRQSAWEVLHIFEQAYPNGEQHKGCMAIALFNQAACDRFQELYRLERGCPADPGVPVDDAARIYLTPEELKDQIRDAGFPDPEHE